MKTNLADETLTLKSNVPLPAEMWGVTMLIIIRDIGNLLKCKIGMVGAMRLAFGISAMTVNLVLQSVILWYVHKYIVDQAVHDTQVNYRQYHAEVFNVDGSFNATSWHFWTGPYMELCNLAVSKESFTFAILFIWTARMLGEVRSIERLVRDINSINGNDGRSPMVEEFENDDGIVEECHITSLTVPARFALYVFVVIPKLLIAAILMFIGCRWLCATESFSDLILNALALEFVIGVDELIYDNFAPAAMKDWLEMTSMLHIKGSKHEKDSTVIMGYLRSMMYLGLCLGFAYAYIAYLQQVIPGFTHDIQEHCDGWFQKKYEPICPANGDTETCFPYGPPVIGGGCPCAT